MVKIYTLEHPFTREIRYVGYTKTSLKTRLKKHISDAKSRKPNHRHNWLNSLPVSPIIRKIDIAEFKDRNWLEKMYISLFKSWGFNLINATEGGDGGDTWSKLSPEKLKIAKEKLSKAHKGKKQPYVKGQYEKVLKHLNNYNNKIKKGEIKHPTKGRILTEEEKKKCGSHNIGRTTKWKGQSKYGKVGQFDLNDNLIAVFENPALAAQYFYPDSKVGDKRPNLLRGNIVRAAKGKQKSCKGFKWKFM